jgi:hypothetical protein
MSLNLTSCGNNVQDILHLLAAAIVKDASGVKYLRVDITQHDCADISAVASCGEYNDPKELLKQIAYTDDCGENLIIKISVPSIPA